MKTTIKGYDGDDENNVDLSVYVVDGESIVGAVRAGDGETGSWMTPEQLRDLAREVLALSERVSAANAALSGGAA